MPTTTPLPLHALDRAALLRRERALTREWLETDGRGGYASSTALLCPTRRYHGLLVAPAPGTAERHVFLARLDEELRGGERSFPLSTARYPGITAPEGYQSLESFELRPWPAWHHAIGLAQLEREILMVRGQPTVLVRWTLGGERRGLRLRFRPLFACRPADALTWENLALDPRAQRIGGGIRYQAYESLPAVHLTLSGGEARFSADPLWYRAVEYRADLNRGYDGHEDHFSPGHLELDLEPGSAVVLAATLGAPVADPAALWRSESERRSAAVAAAAEGLRGRLELAAEHFLYTDAAGRPGVIAGYPWFGEWGRDTFISLPGLTLARGRVEECRAVLEAALPFLRDGLLPNVFGATPTDSHYGSADAALWFARAVRLYETGGGERPLVLERFRPALRSIAEAYEAGTGLSMFVDDGGLLHVGEPGLNATWMDARTADGPVTPRHGFPVEVQGLWCFLLAYLEHLAHAVGDTIDERRWAERRARAEATFLERLWMPEEERLADGWLDGRRDDSLRPNMVIAAALEFSPLAREQRAGVLQVASSQLVTPFGLRTLDPRDPRYEPRYQGGPAERDRAYHQGTVWPWLLGFQFEGWLRLAPAAALRRGMRLELEGFLEHLGDFGLGQVSEVFDADPPHRAGGTPAQAWSVAELLRALWMLEAEE